MATWITMLRIIGAVSLLIFEPFSTIFYVIYIMCGVSDKLDGYVARKTNTASKTGATLDSIADFIFVTVMVIIFVPLISWEWWLIIWLAGITIIRFASLGVRFAKFREIGFSHSYANKITGVMLFLFPLFYYIINISIAAVVLCGIASWSAIEELVKSIKGVAIKEAEN